MLKVCGLNMLPPDTANHRFSPACSGTAIGRDRARVN
jgi:hypothetical protein